MKVTVFPILLAGSTERIVRVERGDIRKGILEILKVINHIDVSVETLAYKVDNLQSSQERGNWNDISFQVGEPTYTELLSKSYLLHDLEEILGVKIMISHAEQKFTVNIKGQLGATQMCQSILEKRETVNKIIDTTVITEAYNLDGPDFKATASSLAISYQAPNI